MNPDPGFIIERFDCFIIHVQYYSKPNSWAWKLVCAVQKFVLSALLKKVLQ